MGLFALSDLHLSSTANKPMDVFGDNWINHDKKIKDNWERIISEDDTVLIAGDISWSMKMEDGLDDLKYIHSLPGRKIIVKGNHDYWWSGIKKLNKLYDDMEFLQNNFFTYEDYAICGTRGWILKENPNFDVHDEKILRREKIRLQLSIDSACKSGYKDIIIMMHYPPFNYFNEDNDFSQLFERYNVRKVIYGHLHGPNWREPLSGNKNDIQYYLTSCDYINFCPIKIL